MPPSSDHTEYMRLYRLNQKISDQKQDLIQHEKRLHLLLDKINTKLILIKKQEELLFQKEQSLQQQEGLLDEMSREYRIKFHNLEKYDHDPLKTIHHLKDLKRQQQKEKGFNPSR